MSPPDLNEWMRTCARTQKTVWALVSDGTPSSSWREFRVIDERGKGLLRVADGYVDARYWHCVEVTSKLTRDLLAAQCFETRPA